MLVTKPPKKPRTGPRTLQPCQADSVVHCLFRIRDPPFDPHKYGYGSNRHRSSECPFTADSLPASPPALPNVTHASYITTHSPIRLLECPNPPHCMDTLAYTAHLPDQTLSKNGQTSSQTLACSICSTTHTCSMRGAALHSCKPS